MPLTPSSGVQNNFASTRAPVATDDSGAGYAAGSVWMRPDTTEMWRCRSAAVGAARWIKTDTSDHPGYVANRYYTPFNSHSVAAASALITTTTYWAYGVIKERITLSQLGTRVSTVSAGGNFQLAIYSADPATIMPKALLGNTASLSTGTAAVVNGALSQGNVQVEPGPYWFGIQCDNTTATFLAQGLVAANYSSEIGSATAAVLSATVLVSGLTSAGTFGTWPADLGSTTFTDLTTGRAPLVQFLVASVP